MSQFNFKSYHIRSMNASSEEEKARINQELKEMYSGLSAEDQVKFNAELQSFLIKEMGIIQSMVQAAKEDE